MNGLGKTADRTSTYFKPGSRSKSIFEALAKANGTSIYEMLREPHGGSSIFEEVRFARHQQAGGKGRGDSLLQRDWKKRT